MVAVSSKSANGGRTWGPLTLVRARIGSTPLGDRSGDPQTVYVGTGGGVFKTTDGGRPGRRRTADSFAMRMRTPAITECTRATSTPSSSILGTPRPCTQAPGQREDGRGLLKTTNGGASWQPLAPRFDEGALVLDPNEPETVYVSGGGVSRAPMGQDVAACGLQGTGVVNWPLTQSTRGSSTQARPRRMRRRARPALTAS